MAKMSSDAKLNLLFIVSFIGIFAFSVFTAESADIGSIAGFVVSSLMFAVIIYITVKLIYLLLSYIAQDVKLPNVKKTKKRK